MAHAVIQ